MLLDNPSWGDRLWCPSNGHGGNGAFFEPSATKEGYEMSGSGLSESQIRALRGDAQASVDDAEQATEADAPAKRGRRAPKVAKPKAEKVVKVPQDCECGCGEKTKGGRFIPGHDARLHSRWNAQAKALGHANWKDAQAAGVAFDTPEVIAAAEAAKAAAQTV